MPKRHQPLDKWLVVDAETETKRGSARVWVWLDDRRQVVGYYSLSASKLKRDDIPKALERGGPVEIPGVLLGRLALDRSLRGQRVGEVLLADALAPSRRCDENGRCAVRPCRCTAR